MELSTYTKVIKAVLIRNGVADPEAVVSEIVSGIEIAQAIMGDVTPVTTRPQKVASQTRGAAIKTLPLKVNSKPASGIILFAAPPVAGTEDLPEAEEDIDYWESKLGKGDGCNRLQAKLQSLLPQSITVKVPAVDEPLTLVCGIGSPGVRFVHVNYSVPGGEMGPRVTLMTSMKPESIDVNKILEDIAEQACAIYSKEKRTIQPHAGPPPPQLTSQDLDRILARDRAAQQPNDGVSGKDAVDAAEAAAEWGRNRSVRWQ